MPGLTSLNLPKTACLSTSMMISAPRIRALSHRICMTQTHTHKPKHAHRFHPVRHYPKRRQRTLCVSVCAGLCVHCVLMCACVNVCVCTYVSLCVCVCVCVLYVLSLTVLEGLHEALLSISSTMTKNNTAHKCMRSTMSCVHTHTHTHMHAHAHARRHT